MLNLSLPIVDPVLIVAVAMGIFLVAPVLMERLRLPGVIGVIVAGAIVGPNGLNLLARDQTIVLLGAVGLLYLIFMAGIAIDLHGFRRYRNRSLGFGAISYLLPQGVGTGVGLMLGLGLPGSLLLGSMFGSHTLVAYPIAIRYGIAKNRAVTTAVGGSIITDTSALLMLAVVAASTRGALDAAFWMRLVLFLALYVAVVWLVLPRVARWFFRHERTGAVAEYIFVLTVLFGGAYMARVAGVETIVGAFMVGLALNRLLPENGLLTSRIQFVGEAFFIPFFLLSVGMLADVRVLAGDIRAWQVMIAMTVTVIAMKGLSAKLAQRLFGYTAEEGWTMAGLTIPQAAATLAVALIGLEVGLLDDAVLNGAIMMIIGTCILGPWLVEKYGRQVALQEEQKPYDPHEAPQRIIIPVSNPATAEDLLDLALAIREPGSPEALLPLTVVPTDDDSAAEYVANAEKMLSHAVAYAAGAGVQAFPLTRVDYNFADGIARGVAETRSSLLIVGWDGQRSPRRGIFGSVLDQLLERTRLQVMVSKLGHPLNTTERIIVLLPQAIDRVPGFLETVRTVKLLANRLGTPIRGYVVADSPERFREYLERVKPNAPVSVETTPSWTELVGRLKDDVRRDDLVIAVSPRRGAVSWVPSLERLPGRLAGLVPESFIMCYPSEAAPQREREPLLLPAALDPDTIVLDMPRVEYEEALRRMVQEGFQDDVASHDFIVQELVDSVNTFGAQVRPGIVVAHTRLRDLPRPRILLATSRAGIEFPHTDEPARLVFVILSNPAMPDQHLTQWADVARFASNPEAVETLMAADDVSTFRRRYGRAGMDGVAGMARQPT
jgi:Kef-type K+ transport system membrane component KefB/mannitol/fructose-specific phosphotransferase system IIA component (Ntr-type)/nucleotide-binding universal stress UspA family protein